MKALRLSVSCCFAPLVKVNVLPAWVCVEHRGCNQCFYEFLVLCEDSTKEKGYALSDLLVVGVQ